MIKPILYERIEQKKEIERELFSQLNSQEQKQVKKTWMDFLAIISRSRNLIHRKTNDNK